MAYPSTKKKRVLPGFGLTLGTSLLFTSLFIMLPLTALVVKAASTSWEQYWGYISDPRAIATYKLTLTCALWATLINISLGFWAAWILARFEFPGRRLLDAIIDLPFALPTAVAGLSLAALTVPAAPIGGYFAQHGIKIAYAIPGIVLAMSFTSFPFVVRTVQPVIEDMEPSAEEGALSLGAGPFTTFFRVLLPQIMPAIFAGGTVAFVRSLGEFGAIVFISGNLPFRTEITALLIFIRIQEYDYVGAAALASVILGFAFVTLIVMNVLQGWHYRRLAPI
ncbi:MAG TPA: sulfate ABC transporter permease subunit CysT [Kiritimatiellia bacterium]|nr:sulfate ABC transporter permease subunit CysT [Kiritimatiellia bacterium]